MERYVVHAFADRDAPGSPTGVVLDAGELDEARMLQMTRSLNVSHTAFLSQPRRADCDLAIRFFTPKGELKNCAHATIAAHFMRATKLGFKRDQPVRQETVTGVQEVWIQSSEEGVIVFFRQDEVAQENVSAETVERLCTALGIEPAALHPTYPVRRASPGTFRFMVPVKSQAEVAGLRPYLRELEQLCVETQSLGCFVFSIDPESRWKAHARMFAPAIGVDEDAVNGNSSGCLGAYLMDLEGDLDRLELEVLQGLSLVRVEAKKVDQRIKTYVGGGARLVHTPVHQYNTTPYISGSS